MNYGYLRKNLIKYLINRVQQQTDWLQRCDWESKLPGRLSAQFKLLLGDFCATRKPNQLVFHALRLGKNRPKLHRGFCTGEFLIYNLNTQRLNYFKQFQLRTGRNNNTDTEFIGTYCSTDQQPGLITSKYNTVYLDFGSDFSISYAGFRLEWVVNGKGNFYFALQLFQQILMLNYVSLYQFKWPFTTFLFFINI